MNATLDVLTVVLRSVPASQPTPPAAAVSLAGQAVTWGLVVAVAVIVLSAAGWAIASAGARPATVSRAKTGVAVALVGAILLGAGKGYLAWLNTTQAPGFTADPASYAVDTVAPPPGFEVIDKTTAWTSTLNQIRTGKGLQRFGTDRALSKLVASCATHLAGGKGICPQSGQYWRTTLSPSQIVQLSDPLTEKNLTRYDPNALDSIKGFVDDMRIAFVAVRNTQNGKAVVLVMHSVGPCPAPCTPKSPGAAMPNLITHRTGP
jgi:hypothetical protein